MPKYEVENGGTKLLDDFRGDRIYGDSYFIKKDGITAYEVIISTFGDYCTCPGGIHHGKCKHVQMVYNFLGER